MLMADAARLCVIPTLNWLGYPYASAKACCILLAIGKQESGWVHRRQRPSGPARGHYQIETRTAMSVLDKWGHGRAKWQELFPKQPIDTFHVRQSVELSEAGACLVARGILWLDPNRLPNVDPTDEAYAWWLYETRCWRPGKPRPEFWCAHWREAVDVTLRCWQ